MARKISDLAKGYALEAGSALAHWIPPLRPLARKVTGMTGAHDTLLRWRVARDAAHDSVDSRWETMQGPKGAVFKDRATWGMGVVAVNRKMEAWLGTGETSRRPGIAYCLGSVVMIGVNEMNRDSFLGGVNDDGTYNSAAEKLGVVVSNGPGVNTVALGVVAPSGRHMLSRQTRLLAEVSAVPDGLQRV